jgi:ABC-type glycerol-3-phosphate transport system substrate-binding protein
LAGFGLLFAGGSQSSGPAAPSQSSQGGITKYNGEIIVSIWADDESGQAGFNALAKAYNKLQPDVKLTFEPSSGGDAAIWLTTQLAAGNVRPDVVSGNLAGNYPNYVDLNLYRTYKNQYTGRIWQDELDFDLVNDNNGRGEKFYLASEAVHILWFYNKTIFDKLGLKPPKTDVEYVQVCEKLLAAGYIPSAVEDNIPCHWFQEVYRDQFTRHWDELMRALPGDWSYNDSLDGKFKYDPNNPNLGTDYTYSAQRLLRNIRDGKIRFDSPEMIAWATAHQKFFNSKYSYPEWTVDDDWYSKFLVGNVGMMPQGTWVLNSLPKDLEALGSGAFEWGTFENPEMTGSQIKGLVRSIEAATGIYLSIVKKNPQKTAMAVDFINYWLSQEGYQIYIDGRFASPLGYAPGGLVGIKGVAFPPEIQARLNNIKLMGNAEYNGKCIQNIFTTEYKTQTDNLMWQMINYEITPQQYCSGLQKIITDNFDRIVANYNLTKEDIDHPERMPSQR